MAYSRRHAPVWLTGIAALLLLTGLAASAQAQIAPRVIVLFDTSGSMTFDLNGNPTHGDGSTDHPGLDTNGDGQFNDSRMFIAKEAVRDILLDPALDGDIEFGLMRYHQVEGLNIRNEGATSPRYREPINYDGTGSCSPTSGGANVLVPVGAGTRANILQWMDGVENFPTNKELRGSHWTPLGLSLQDARQHMIDTVIGQDPLKNCRNYYVIMITDGNPECSPAEPDGSWVTAAGSLRTTRVSGVDYDVKTFIVGFGSGVDGSDQLNRMARAGGTAVNDQGAIDLVDGRALFATDRARLRSMLQSVLTSITRDEVCDGRDNDCDSEIDEDFPTLGDACEAGIGACRDTGALVCAPSGTNVMCSASANPRGIESCNNVDDDCDGAADEGLFNACGTCGAPPAERCDGNDNDCDGEVDEGLLNACGRCGATPAETCNGVDDDCDGEFDEGVQNACGGCGANPVEDCDGADNDCDLVIDEGFDTQCGECRLTGVETCDGSDNDCDARIDEGTRNACGTCGNAPTETCNSRDDDCDGEFDEGVLNACGTCGTPPAERCDDEDNDCDGEVDEGTRNACNRCDDLREERCDNVDNDCDGQIDENVTCPVAGAVCINGECAEPCQAGECFGGTICQDGFCLTPCSSSACPGGLVCTEGDCSDPCAGIICPKGTECAFGACVEGGCEVSGCAPGEACQENGECTDDLCLTTACAATQGCRDGECLDTCLGIQCPGGQACRAGRCTDDLCAGRTCPFGKVCDEGSCIEDPCINVRCELGQACFDGRCEPDPCIRTHCPDGTTCLRGECTVDGADSGTIGPDESNNEVINNGDGNNDNSGGPINNGPGAGGPSGAVPPGDEACHCSTPARSPALALGLLGLLAVGALALLRRR